MDQIKIVVASDDSIFQEGLCRFLEDQEDLEELKRFYDAHWRFFESKEEQIEYPGFPVQGNWRVDGVDLPDDVLDKLYLRNARRLIPGLQA